jgi:hypothetical protein
MTDADSKTLTRAEVISSDDLRRELVAVPEWGGSIMLHTLSVAERLALAELAKSETGGQFGLRLVIASAIDEDGNRLFGEGDMAALANKSHAAVERLVRAAVRVNAMAGDDVETAAKN